MIVRGTSAHLIGQHSRATTKFVFLEIVFRLEAKIIKLKAGHGGFLCQCAKAFPANIIVLLAPPESYFVTALPSGSAIHLLCISSRAITSLLSRRAPCYSQGNNQFVCFRAPMAPTTNERAVKWRFSSSRILKKILGLALSSGVEV